MRRLLHIGVFSTTYQRHGERDAECIGCHLNLTGQQQQEFTGEVDLAP